jgi:rhamnosyltransferase
MKNPLISIIIPVKNGASTIEACLKGIFSQTIKDIIEIIIIDSGSSDGTLEILNKFPVRLFQISPSAFNHGLTRNYGISMASGEFILLTVQDAIASTTNWLEIMFKHFINKEVMGVCGQQIVPHHPDKNPLEWFMPISEPGIQIIKFETGEFEKLDGKTQNSLCGWDDVNAMYRKSALLDTPFIETNFAEDAAWAKAALSKGYQLVYDNNAKVYHYHHHNFKFAFKRTYIGLYHTKLIFNYHRRFNHFFKQFSMIFYRTFLKKQVPGKKIYWIYYNINILIAQYCASIVFNINSLLLRDASFEKAYKYWVGQPPQGKLKS